jgi:hypothetical protein
MKISETILLFCLLLPQLSTTAQQTTPAVPPQHNLMPVPASIQFAPGRLPITNGFQVATRNYSDARLVSAINRMISRLSGRTGITPALPLQATTVRRRSSSSARTGQNYSGAR